MRPFLQLRLLKILPVTKRGTLSPTPHTDVMQYAPLEKMEYLKLTWSNLSFDKIYSLHCTGLSTNDETVRRLETLNYDSSKVKLRLLPSSFQ